MPLSKKDVTILKGVSILIMIFLHTFLHKSDVSSCSNFLYIFNSPLVSLLDRYAGICISLYLFLGGYGLYLRRQSGPMHNGRRIFLLYLNYWFAMIPFLLLGSFLAPGRYPGSFTTFLMNFSAIDYSYNDTWWFLMPYILLIISSSILFKVIDNCSGWMVFIVTYFICIGTSYTISRYGSQYLYGRIYYIPFLWFHLLNSFVTGAIFAKYDIFDLIKKQLARMKKYRQQLLIYSILIASIIFRIWVNTSIFNIFIVITLFACIMSMKRYHEVDKLLNALGKESTNMWYVHAFFCFYLFHDFIYSFKYPIIIYLLVVLLSYVTARAITFIYAPCRAFVLKKWNSSN